VKLIPDSRRSSLIRFAIAAVLVVAFTATTTAVAGLLVFKQLATDIGVTPALKHANVTIPNPGNPQTILIIGSDHRAGEPFNSANTDTMMLVRMDPDSKTINVISIPRDLKVDVPREGTAKLNSAYSVGGPNMLIRVLKGQVFPDLHVNHIIDVNFGGFSALVNAIGCVYTDVDHRYYNDTAVTNYSSINLHPGYQKLCGPDALSFVRFRHTDNDIVRNARQQDFIRWAKDQYGASQLISNRDKLLKIFGQHVQTDPDLHSLDGVINLFNLVAFSAGHTIKQIKFPAIILPCNSGPVGRHVAVAPCYVTAEPPAEQRAFNTFMTATKSAPSPGGGGKPRPGGGGGGGGGGPSSNLTTNIADGKAQAAALGNMGMPVYFPRQIASGSTYATGTGGGPTSGEYPRPYQIHDQNGNSHPAYRMTILMNPGLGEYYGVQGTTWREPPILKGANETRFVNGKKLELFFNGGKLTVVGWRVPDGVYWISNTLTDDLTNQQMLAIASSLTKAGA